jgi:hypothetical protein
MENSEIQEIPQGGISVEQAVQIANTPPSWIPPKIIKRNEYGLIEGIEYFYTPEGTIDWRKMISPKFLVPNKQNFEKRGKPAPESINGLDDRDLLILLQGIKTIAQIRGFCSVNYNVVSPSSDCVLAVCSICWMENFETENRPVIFSAIGDATPVNCTSFGKAFLGPVAENRAFVRAVRNFLKINIVSQEEMGNPLSSDAESDTTSEKLSQTMAECGISFVQIKNKLVEEQFPGIEKILTINDIPKIKKLELLGRLKKKIKKTSI